MWTNLCIEAFCFGDTDDNGYCPCGRELPSHICLENGHCPHLGYGKTTERDVAIFPPIALIIKDRLGIWVDDLYWKLRWWFWDRLWFNRRKVDKFFDSIGTVSSNECSELLEFENGQNEFHEWFEGLKNETN